MLAAELLQAFCVRLVRCVTVTPMTVVSYEYLLFLYSFPPFSLPFYLILPLIFTY